jgi:hypothetical protein
MMSAKKPHRKLNQVRASSRNESQYTFFRRTLRKLERLASTALGPRRVDSSDHAVLMVDLFCRRMAESAQTMDRIGAARDTSLIARSMFEGMVNLVYANADLSRRATQWAQYALVHNRKFYKRRAAHGDAVAHQKYDRICDEIQASPYYDIWFPPGKRPSDNWRGQKLRETVDEVIKIFNARPTSGVGEPLTTDIWYGQAYAQLSEWHHWDVAGLTRAFNADTWDFHPQPDDKTVGAFAFGIHCLYETVTIADKVLGLVIGAQVEQQMEKFNAFLSNAKEV